LILIPAGPGALIGGWLGEHIGLRAALGFSGGMGLLLALVAWRHPVIRGVRELPQPEDLEAALGAEATVVPPAEAVAVEQVREGDGLAAERPADTAHDRAADPAGATVG
jgi:hypothetical protein